MVVRQEDTKGIEQVHLLIMKKKILVSSGCSQAYGQNLPDRSNRYSAVIARNFDLDLIDVSVCGASNESIAYQTIIGLNKAFDKGYNSSEILVLTGWTTPDRIDVFNVAMQRYGSAFVNLGVNNNHTHGNAILEQSNIDIATQLREKMWHDGIGYMKHLNAINYVMSFCESQNVSLIQVLNLPSYDITLPKGVITNSNLQQQDYTDFLKVIPHKYRNEVLTMFRKKTLLDVTKVNPALYWNHPKYDSHPSAAGHKLWADKIIAERGESFK